MATTIIDDGAFTEARPTTGRRRGGGSDENRAGWALSVPFLVLYVLFLIGPAVYGLVMSFFILNHFRSSDLISCYLSFFHRFFYVLDLFHLFKGLR